MEEDCWLAHACISYVVSKYTRESGVQDDTTRSGVL
jgi:hypothetical protein